MDWGLIIGIAMPLAVAGSLVFLWRRKPNQSLRDRATDFE